MNSKILLDVFKEVEIPKSIEINSLVYGSGQHKEFANAPVTDIDYIRNKHLNNPLGFSTRIVIQENDSNTGQIFVIPRAFCLKGEIYQFMVASDLVSKSKIPGGGVILFKETRKLARLQKKPLLNFSNKKSDRIYSSILKMEPILELDFNLLNLKIHKIFLVKSLLLLKNQITPKNQDINECELNKKMLKFEKMENFDERIEVFLRNLIEGEENLGFRSSKILNWRFHSSNNVEYTKLLIQRDGEVKGYVVLCEKDYKGMQFGVIVDSILVDFDRKELKIIKKKLLDILPRAIGIIGVRNKESKCSIISQFGGISIPKKFLPNRVKFYLSNSDGHLIDYFKRAHLTLFDTDIL
jgi:hypothetical protein